MPQVSDKSAYRIFPHYFFLFPMTDFPSYWLPLLFVLEKVGNLDNTLYKQDNLFIEELNNTSNKLKPVRTSKKKRIKVILIRIKVDDIPLKIISLCWTGHKTQGKESSSKPDFTQWKEEIELIFTTKSCYSLNGKLGTNIIISTGSKEIKSISYLHFPGKGYGHQLRTKEFVKW